MWFIAFAYLTTGELHAVQCNDDVYIHDMIGNHWYRDDINVTGCIIRNAGHCYVRSSPTHSTPYCMGLTGDCLGVVLGLLGVVWGLLGTSMRQTCDRHATDMRQTCDRHATDMRQTPQTPPDMRQTCDRHATEVFTVCVLGSPHVRTLC